VSWQQNRRSSYKIREMEGLEPKPFGRGRFEPGEANCEYPFLLKSADATPLGQVEIKRPQTYFDLKNRLRYCRIAHELLTALVTLEPAIAVWEISLPAKI